jgi:hypothetical protein
MTSASLRNSAAVVFLGYLLTAASPAAAQSPVAATGAIPVDAADAAVFAPNEPARDYKAGKVIHARRVSGTAPQIDGRLNDEIWNGADAAVGFTQRDPDNGKPMTEDTRIQVAYDNRYLYIAVTCLDSGQVSGGLGRRDEEPPTDMVNIGLDPRHDHLTGYLFQTNPSSWQGDMSLFDDDRSDRDFNSNWEVRSQITETGWTAEFRIPFSQMRFLALPAPGQVWGFDAKREIKRKGEQGFWVARPRGERGDTSRFGHLVFDEPLTPPGRLELLPYTLSRSEVSPIVSTAGNVTDRVSAYGMSVGGDVRYGLGPSTTVSATINPDFGQVEQDPSVLNLSIYETFFPEKRPFFLEDSRTFVPPYGLFQVFHSRRIGRTPDRFALQADDTDVKKPSDTTIIGAAKLTGKSSGWTYGVLTAETSREYAEVTPVDSTGVVAPRVDRLIEPFTSYNVVRVQRDLRGSSNIGAIASGVVREQTDDAFTGGFDYNIRWNRTRDYFNGHWVVTHAPVPSVGVRNGFGGVMNVGFNRKHGNFGVHADHFGTNFRVNDIGFLRTRTDRNRVDANYEIGQPDPGKWFRQYWLGGFAGQSWNHERLVFDRNYETYFAYQFLNFWRGHFGTGGNMERQDDRDTRGGPPIVVPSDHYGFFHLESDSRKSWQWTMNIVAGGNRVGSYFSNWNTNLTLQPSDRIQTSLSLGYNRGLDHAQWITSSEDADADGVTDFVYGTLRRNVVDLTMRATYAFNRDLTLQAYLQPFVAVGDYFDVRKLARPSSYDFSPVSLSADPDFNAKSLNSNIVLRWEYVKGSTLFVVWNAGTFDDSRPGRFNAGRDLRGAFGAPANHVFIVKASYWINR